MATGPEHYQAAERLVSDAHDNQFHQGSGDPVTPELLAEAQIHATLALAAATALGHYTPEADFPQADRMAWYIAASEGPGEKQRQREAVAAELAGFTAVAQAAGTERKS